MTSDTADRAAHPPAPLRRIAVVGAGAAGTLTAAQLLRRATARRQPLEVWLIDPAEAGLGVAYRTGDPRHLLNVPAGAMSAFPDDPDHFLRWLAAWESCPGSAEGHQPHHFLPRGTFGRYLGAVLAQAAADGEGLAELHRVPLRVVDLAEEPRGLLLTLSDGSRLPVQAAVLALGLREPGLRWAPPALREHPGLVTDPWAPGALAAVPEEGEVLLVGTGLTMADLAVSLSRPARVLHAVSRHGLAPHGHRVIPLPASAAPRWPLASMGAPAGAPTGAPTSDLAGLRRAVLRHVAGARRACGDWRPGVDSLRPHTSALWQRLSEAERIRFLREDLRHWEVHRHRLAPATAATVQHLRDQGLLTVTAAEVAAAEPAADGALRVRLSDGRALTVAAVVNCTGATAELTGSADPLHRALLTRGLAAPGPAGQGLATTEAGRLRRAVGGAPAPLWTLGVLRRGELLESTAIPEIRNQAAELARALLPDPVECLVDGAGGAQAGRTALA
ncbi:FAD/NAD(P)-binding protein [Kitasatospora sp. NBC_01287]|uniref:FAD/NAD(P)-binding protein n=1 Tax=Kitasatospora sp. NBC_01287 TaxID=2903573 RepID=UPI00224D3E41|nr:FAD/NAD(P)-binding protein [Kitasatospora sp. NBC_01287]MCX4744411.1 FAD/NAD(P)-binding protein [Kitasatospora sp. NBC_01287]